MNPFKLETKYLFRLLLRFLQPDLVCDIGTMDGSDAKRFRRYVSRARILAFEANPQNIAALEQDEEIARQRVEIVRQAVWNRDGELSFFVEDTGSEETAEEMRRGISSTRPRTVNSFGNTKVTVEAVRLDEFVRELTPEPECVALWIDVEGGAYEVLEGLEGIRDRVGFIHVEVETKEYWQGQKMKGDVVRLMDEMGFVVLARGPVEEQHDLVLMNKKQQERSPLLCKFLVYFAYFITGKIHIF